jgi:hypothetical protein
VPFYPHLITLGSIHTLQHRGPPRLAGPGAPQQRILARLNRNSCNPEALRGADGGTAAWSASVGSSASVGRMRAAVAAAGLAYERELSLPCWIVVTRTQAASAAGVDGARSSIMALLAQPGSSGSDASTAAPSMGSGQPGMFDQAVVDGVRYLARNLHTSGEGSTPQEVSPSPSSAPPGWSGVAGLPTECAGGSCSRMWGMNRIRAPGVLRDAHCAFSERDHNVLLAERAPTTSGYCVCVAAASSCAVLWLCVSVCVPRCVSTCRSPQQPHCLPRQPTPHCSPHALIDTCRAVGSPGC